MKDDRQDLLKELQELKRIRDGKRKRMSFLEESSKEVKEYKRHQGDLEFLDEKISTTIHKIRYQCHHTFFEIGFEHDGLLDSNVWKIKCIACGYETVYYQMSDLDKKPNKEMIFQNNAAHLDFNEAKRYFGKFEKEVGEEEARRKIFALSRVPRK